MLSVQRVANVLPVIFVLGALTVLAQMSATPKPAQIQKSVQPSPESDSHVPALNSDDVAKVHVRLSETAGPDGIPLYTPGNLDIALELPAAPNLLEKQPLSKQITDSRCFASAGKGIGVFIGYSAKARAFDLKEYAAEFVGEVQARAGLANVRYSTGPKSPSSLSVYGTFKVNGATGELNGVVLSSGSRDWVVLTVYPRDKDDSHDLAEQILHSIAITSGHQSSASASGSADNASGTPVHER